jgi:hypothetical protein
MAVVFTKAAAITALDTAGGVIPNAVVEKAALYESVGVIEVANGDSIASIFRMVRVPSNARVSRIGLVCDAITGAIGDVGLYLASTPQAAGAVVDVDFFASAQAFTAAILTYTEIAHEAGGAGAQNGEIANIEKRLWEVLGLSADPIVFYDIAATLTAAATAAGTLGFKVLYSV